MTIKIPLPSDLSHYETLICMWIGSDPVLLAAARELARGDEFAYGNDDLAEWIITLLYAPEYKTEHYPRDLVWVEQQGGDVSAARTARASLPERALLDINSDGWARIRTALLTETSTTEET